MGRAKPDKRELVLQKWNEYEETQAKNGKTAVQTEFVKNSQGTKWETNISSLREWTGRNKPRTKAAQQQMSNNSTQLGLLGDIEQEFNEYYESQKPAAFAQYLKERQEEIKQKMIADAEKQLHEAISKLTQKENN